MHQPQLHIFQSGFPHCMAVKLGSKDFFGGWFSIHGQRFGKSAYKDAEWENLGNTWCIACTRTDEKASVNKLDCKALGRVE